MSLHIGAAAHALASIRTHTARTTGCPEWDPAGISRALEATQGSPGDVLAAAALAASDPKLRLPSAAGFTNHWPRNAIAEPRVSHNIPCPDHPEHDMPCPVPPDPIDPTIVASIAAQARTELAKGIDRFRARPLPGRVPTPGDQEQP